MKTIREIAKTIGKTKSTVEIRMNKIPDFREKHTKRKNGMILVDDAGVDKLVNMTGYGSSKHNTKQKSKSNNPYRDVLINELKRELDDKNSMIKYLKRENVAHLEQISGLQQTNRKQKKLINVTPKTPKKKSWWRRIF